MPIPDEIKLRVAHVDLILDRAFDRSVTHWRSPVESECRWSIVESPSQSLLIGRQDALVVEGSAATKLFAPDGGVVHVTGNLNSELETGHFHEVIICGDVTENAIIRATGFSHIYIGGSMSGRIETTGSAKIWIDGDFDGFIATGNPFMTLYVTGDCRGVIMPHQAPALLYLVVSGFASRDKLTEIAAIGYTVFNASVGFSDAKAGLYPDGPGRRSTPEGNSYSRWCVLAQRVAGRS
jgi:hypothetical protein